jgi:hypothetical protein
VGQRLAVGFCIAPCALALGLSDSYTYDQLLNEFECRILRYWFDASISIVASLVFLNYYYYYYQLHKPAGLDWSCIGGFSKLLLEHSFEMYVLAVPAVPEPDEWSKYP